VFHARAHKRDVQLRACTDVRARTGWGGQGPDSGHPAIKISDIKGGPVRTHRKRGTQPTAHSTHGQNTRTHTHAHKHAHQPHASPVSLASARLLCERGVAASTQVCTAPASHSRATPLPPSNLNPPPPHSPLAVRPRARARPPCAPSVRGGSARANTPGSVVNAVRVGAVGAAVQRARPALGVRCLRETHAGQVRLGLEVEHRKLSDCAELHTAAASTREKTQAVAHVSTRTRLHAAQPPSQPHSRPTIFAPDLFQRRWSFQGVSSATNNATKSRVIQDAVRNRAGRDARRKIPLAERRQREHSCPHARPNPCARVARRHVLSPCKETCVVMAPCRRPRHRRG